MGTCSVQEELTLGHPAPTLASRTISQLGTPSSELVHYPAMGILPSGQKHHNRYANVNVTPALSPLFNIIYIIDSYLLVSVLATGGFTLSAFFRRQRGQKPKGMNLQRSA